jgi:xeroderma pigmentosum group C-complementing protein
LYHRNIDIFAEHMCPEGRCTHALSWSKVSLQKLQIYHAEPVVNFTFGHRMEIPVIQGAAIVEKNYGMVILTLGKDGLEGTRNEDEKQTKEGAGTMAPFPHGYAHNRANQTGVQTDY